MKLFLFYSLFSVIHDISHPDPPFPLCDTPKFAEKSTYRATLDNLLSNVSSTAALVPKFYNISVGTDSDRVYGLFLCYEYSPDNECRRCIQTVPQDIRRLCMYRYEAVVWEEYCLFRYSTQNFFGQLNVIGNIRLDNKQNISEPELFRSVVNETLHNLTKLAAFNSSFHMHSEGAKPITENKTLYAFVQCSQDLSPRDCNTCLEIAIKEILDCCYFSRGARLLSRSCFLRYELYEFYEGASEFNVSQTDPNALPKSGKQIEKWMIAVIAFGSGILLLSALGCCFVYIVPRNQTRRVEMKIQDRDNLDVPDHNFGLGNNLDPQECPAIEMNVIEEATDNFSASNKLGQGGFGPVFKGILPDGQEIAVKRLSSNSEQGSDEFINEVLLIFKLQHVNLVKLLGFCVQEEEKLLAYEYMPNGSLDGFLWDSRKRAQLNWTTRLNIINGVSRGMLYLHQDSRLKIIHRDLKPSNVLLDAHMNPKISDFGMARIFGDNDGEANTARIVGTHGYMAPEFAMEGVYSIKSDVFSFGVLLLEIITGKRNAGFHLSKLGPSLLAYAWQLWNEGSCLELMDPLLANSCSKEEFFRCMHIGLLCVQEDPHDRPLMSSVVVMLNSNTVPLGQPERPAFTVGKFNNHHEKYFNYLSQNGSTISDLLPR